MQTVTAVSRRPSEEWFESMAMDETAVVANVVDHLSSTGGRVWYNRRGLLPLPYATHEIAIAGRYPDVLCLTDDDRVLAVEAKREGGDLARGLGQALIYRQGAHEAFLAAPLEDLAAVRHVALASGIGLLAIDRDGVVRRTAPEILTAPRHLREIHRELHILGDRAGLPVRRLGSTALSLNHPLHYLVPVVLVTEGADERAALDDIASHWTLDASQAPVQLNGSRLLGLVNADRRATLLTEQGRLVRAMLHDANSRRLGWREYWSGITRARSPLIDSAPIAGGILRFLYLQDPDVVTLCALLRSAGGEANLDRLMLFLLGEAPNIVLNLFSTVEGRPHLLSLLQGGRADRAVSPPVLPSWLLKRSTFQLKRQLVHVGILAPEPAHSGSTASYDPTRDVWRLRDHGRGSSTAG